MVHFGLLSLRCSFRTISSCTGACMWNRVNNSCDLSSVGALAALGGGGANASAPQPLAELASLSLECSQQEVAASCMGACAWNVDKRKCELSGASELAALGTDSWFSKQ